LAKDYIPRIVIVKSMPSLDIAMPIALLLVITAALLLNKRVENRLMATVEQKQFKTRDILLLGAFIVIMISVIAYTTAVAPGTIFQNILLIVFLTSYTMLLFTFSYVFSNVNSKRAQLISIGFGLASITAGLASTLAALTDAYTTLRLVSFFIFAALCFSAAAYEKMRSTKKRRWFLAAQPPALFVLLFGLFNIIQNAGTAMIWTPYLMDVFGFTFAILIILYLSSLFSWKTVGVFAVLLTGLDIFLVIGTGTMVQAAQQFTGLGLPVLVYLPNVPLVYNTAGEILSRGLGLGDFFFAGVLAVQTYKKFSKKIAITAVAAMAVAFGIWEAFLRDILSILNEVVGRNIGGFPGTLMIISGWAPIAIAAWLMYKRKTAATAKTVNQQPIIEASKEPTPPVQ
jgi:hypothetical protein